MLKAGTILNGRYEIQSVTSNGGTTAVYLALDRNLGRKKVAVKEMVVNARRAENKATAVEQFRRQVHLLVSLEHPGLVQVCDFFESEGEIYLVMAYVEGQTLASLVAQRAISVEETVEWADQIGQVLEYLHDQEPPVLFRDVKPSNAMLDHRGRIRLIGLGISRAVEVRQGTSAPLQGVTTAEFAPVEQLGGRATDVRSDVYSLGATMYNLLTGELPPISIDVITGESPPANPRLICPNLPPALEGVVLKAMALRKEDRYPSVRDMRLDLARALATEKTAFAPPGEPQGAGGRVNELDLEGDARRPPSSIPTGVQESSRPGKPGATPPFTPAKVHQPSPYNRADVMMAIGVFVVVIAVLGLGGLRAIRSTPGPAAVATSPAVAMASPSAVSAPLLVGIPSRPVEAPSSPPQARLRITALHVVSTPPGAQLLVDGHEWGVTPLTIQVKPGRHVVQVRKDLYESSMTTVPNLLEKTTRSINVRLRSVSADQATAQEPPVRRTLPVMPPPVSPPRPSTPQTRQTHSQEPALPQEMPTAVHTPPAIPAMPPPHTPAHMPPREPRTPVPQPSAAPNPPPAPTPTPTQDPLKANVNPRHPQGTR